MTEILRLTGVCKAFGGIVVADDVNLSIDAGDAAADGEEGDLHAHRVAAKRGERKFLVAHCSDGATVWSADDPRDEHYCRRRAGAADREIGGRPRRAGDGGWNVGEAAWSAGPLEVADDLQQAELET